MVPSTPHSGLTLHTSNRLERLADQLAELIADPLRSPLLPEIILVQSNGMRRWLEQQIAERHGICSNVQFPFPQKFFHDLLQNAFPQAEATNLFDQEVMTWRIMKDLPRLATRPEFAAISNYLRGERTELRAYELARRIAHVFDQYLVFRPKMILDWDAGEGNDWQPILWRQLQQPAPGQHQAALGLRLIDALKRDRAPVPERVSIFGISTLPPFYISLIGEISARCPVHLFVMEPTPLWWGDIRSKREKARAKQPELFGFDEEDPGDNELLSANGKVGRDFLNLMAELTPVAEDEDLFHRREGIASRDAVAGNSTRHFRLKSGQPNEAIHRADRSVPANSFLSQRGTGAGGFARLPARFVSARSGTEAERHHCDDAGRFHLCALYRCGIWCAGKSEAQNSVHDCRSRTARQ